MMSNTDWARVVDDLLKRFGDDGLIVTKTRGTYDPQIGEAPVTETTTQALLHIRNVKSSELIPGVIEMNDAVITFKAPFITEDYEIVHMGKRYSVVSVSKQASVKNKEIYQKVFARQSGDQP